MEKNRAPRGFYPRRRNGGYQPPPPPPPFTGPPAPENHEPRRDSYGDFFRRALRSLGGDSPSNREMAVFIANQDLELEKIRSEQRAGPDQFQTTVKWPTRKLPRIFDRELESDFTTWKQEVESYFQYYRKEFTVETDKISWIEGILKEKALHWHQARVKAMATQHLDDNWTAYWAAADVQFKNEHEITESARKMRSLKYKGHISDYLVKLRDLNRRVECTGQIFRDQITDQMPSEIVDMMYTMGPIPMEDEEFLRVLERVGKCIEQKKRSHAKGNSSSHKSYSDEKSKKEFKENKEKKDKKEKNYINNENNRIQKKDQKKKRDFKFGSIKEALKGIDEELIAKHKEAKANCWRCRREGHYILECYAKKTEEGVEVTKSTISATRKRKRDDDEESSIMEKRPKVATIETGVQEERRIWENESEEEDF
jgi:hypothetical protein